MNKKAVREIPAVYEDGILRPLEPLDLVEHRVVYVQILEPQAEPSPIELHATATRLLQEAGLVVPAPQPAGDRPAQISPERRAELARLFSAGPPLSELILEDREAH